ncbi:unnamed protein product [Calypogeia fissa]
MKVSNHYRRRKLDKEAIFERVMPAESKPKVKVEAKMEASPSMDEFLEIMKNLSILIFQLVEQNQQSQAVAATDYKCVKNR